MAKPPEATPRPTPTRRQPTHVWVKMKKRSAGATPTRKWNWKKGSKHRVTKREADAMVKDRAAELCAPPERAADVPTGVHATTSEEGSGEDEPDADDTRTVEKPSDRQKDQRREPRDRDRDRIGQRPGDVRPARKDDDKN